MDKHELKFWRQCEDGLNAGERSEERLGLIFLIFMGLCALCVPVGIILIILHFWSPALLYPGIFCFTAGIVFCWMGNSVLNSPYLKGE